MDSLCDTCIYAEYKNVNMFHVSELIGAFPLKFHITTKWIQIFGGNRRVCGE